MSTAMPPSTSCGVCADQPPKYKCPSCELRYCSIVCYKTHKSTTHADADATAAAGPGPGPHPAISFSSAPTTPMLPSVPAPTTSSSPASTTSPIASLLTNPSLAALFTRYPALRHRLQRIYASTQEPDPSTLANDDSPHSHQHHHRGGRGRGRGRGWGRGRGRGRGRGGGGGGGGPWKQEYADRAAVKQLLRMRAWDGEVGEGVREFVTLVAQLRGDGSS